MGNDESADVEWIEEKLRAEAKQLLGRFDSAKLPQDLSARAAKAPSRWIARASTLVAGTILIAACAILVPESRQDREIHADRSEDGQTADSPVVSVRHGAAIGDCEGRNGLHVDRGIRPVVIQLIDDRGESVGSGLLYPEREVPIDFSHLSVSEQEAAYRLLGLDLSDLPGHSI